MKQIIALLLSLGMFLAMTACASPEPAPTETEVPGGSGPSKPTMKEPPRLTVSFGKGDTFDAGICGYSWFYDNGDGTVSGTKADSLHPLDSQLQLIPVETTEDRVELLFEVQPQSLIVRCWQDRHMGDPSIPSGTASVTGRLLELKDGGYVYEVIASWNGDDLAAEGTVRYVFYILKHSIQFAHAHTPSGSSAGTEGETAPW